MTDCRDKRRFRDRIAAELALASAKRKRHEARPASEKRTYRCNLCQGWHLTSEDKR